jgi:hypothetical protein
MTVVRDLLRRSLLAINGIGEGETMSASQEVDSLAALNGMIDMWSTQRLTIYSKIREEFSLVPGQQSYTMGTGGNFNTTRPMKIEYASIELQGSTPPLETPLEIIYLQEWAEVPSKELSSDLPTKLYVEDTFPLATLNLWPKPSAAEKIVTYSWKPLSTVAAGDTLALPPGYEEAMKYNLTIRLASDYGKSVSAEVAKLAEDGLASIKRMNIKPTFLKCDPAVLARYRTFNILTGR